MKKERGKFKCEMCEDSGIKPSNSYQFLMEVCPCGQIERISGGGIRVDMKKVPHWFKQSCELFDISDDL